MDAFIQLVISGLMLGGLFAIVSIGLTIIFGTVHVVNFAHGEFLMIAMYIVYLVTTSLGVHPYLLAPPLIILFYLLGLIVQRFIIQPLLEARDPNVQIFATVGLSIMLMNLALLIFGANIRSTPDLGVRHVLRLGDYRLLTGQLVIFGTTILVVYLLHLFFSKTHIGRGIRATSQNRSAAQLMGVNVLRIYRITFGIGLACVGLAGVLIAPMYPVVPTIGTYFVLISFVVVVLGGMGSLKGAFIGALIIGIIETLSSYYIATSLKEVMSFSLFLLVLIFRPTGLFGSAQTME